MDNIQSTAGGVANGFRIRIATPITTYSLTAVTYSLASPSILTKPAHGLTSGTKVTGSGMSAPLNVTGYVEVINSSTFYLCTDPANLAGSRINSASTAADGVVTVAADFLLSMPGNGAAAENLTIGFADNAQQVYASLVALNVFTPANVQAVAGGPLPNPIDVFLGDDLTNYPWQNISVTSDTMGDAYVYIEPLYVEPRQPSASYDGDYDGYVAWDFRTAATSGSAPVIHNQTGFSIGDGYSALVQSANGESYPGTYATKSFKGAYPIDTNAIVSAIDTNGKRMMVIGYNPFPVPSRINAIFGAASGIGTYSQVHSKDLGTLVPPGYFCHLMSQPCAPAATKVQSSAVKSDTVSVGACYYGGCTHYDARGENRIYFDAVVAKRKTLPIVVLIADDAQTSWKTYGWEILRKFPNLKGKMSFAVIGNSAVGATGIGGTAASYLSIAEVRGAITEGLIAGCVNHSDTHVAFMRTAKSGATGSVTNFVISASDTTAARVFTITFSNGATTADLTSATGDRYEFKDIQAAINAALIAGDGSLKDVTCTVRSLHMWAPWLISTQPIRLEFSKPIALPTIGGANAADITIARGYSAVDVRNDYDACRNVLKAQGLCSNGSENIAAYPNGDYGSIVHEAMVAGGYTLGFCGGTAGNVGDGTDGLHATPTLSIGKIDPFAIGRVDVTIASTVDVVLGDAIRYGGVCTIVIHGIHASATTPGTIISAADLEARFRFLNDNHGKLFTVMSPAELYSYVASLSKSATAWTRPYGAA